MSEPLSEFDARLVEAVREHGWFCMSVGAGDREGGDLR
jgi:hypothetical protein